MRGSDFCDEIRSLHRLPDREDAIFDAVKRGDIVAWDWFELEVPPASAIAASTGGGKTIMVAADYLAIGDVDDFVRMPCSGPLALRICELLGYRLPTEAEVVAIHHAADIKLPALPWGTKATARRDGSIITGDPYGALMLSVERLEAHNAEIEKHRAGRIGLCAGHKKDVLGVRKARAGDVLVARGQATIGVTDVLAFCGWFPGDADAEIQRDDGAHEPSYADYSHGVRFVFEP